MRFVHGLLIRNTEDDAGSRSMDVAAAAVCIQHLRVAAIESTDAKLNLRKVAGHQHMSLGREDESADANRIVGLARTVLQVGVPSGKTACFRRQRHKVTMDAPGGGIDKRKIPSLN